MTIRAIASDYDGTLATNGVVPAATVEALGKFRASGRELLLVTGREIGDLQSVFPEYRLFSWIVGENGALLYQTDTAEETVLAEAVPAAFVEALRQQNIGPLYIGRVLVAMMETHAPAVRKLIEQGNYPLQIILNKESLMVLPEGVNKAYGLRALLPKIGLDAADVAGVGDAENDIDLLQACGFAVAVGNAIPELKKIADWITPGEAGAGIVQLVGRVLNA